MSTTEYVNVERTIQNLKNEVNQENYEAVHDFINHCAAEGIGDSQQQRHIYSLKTLLKKFSPKEFQLRGATEQELKIVLGEINRSSYAEATKAKFRAALKKFYKVENGGKEHPEKVDFFSVHNGNRKGSSVSRDDLFTDQELKELFRGFNNVRDRAFTKTLHETAARPGELLNCSIGDFTANGKGDFIFLEGLKGTPDRTNQLVRAGRTLREWIANHPFGGEMGDIDDHSAPLWVKLQQQRCKKCGDSFHRHRDTCEYVPDKRDKMNYPAYRRRFKDACEEADIPENKRRPYNLRHTRLTEVATFMGYEQLNKFAGWVPGSGRAKVYVHLNNDDVNEAIRDEFNVESEENEEEKMKECAFCGTENQPQHSECRNCSRPLSLQPEESKKEKQDILERLSQLEEKGVLEKLEKLDIQ